MRMHESEQILLIENLNLIRGRKTPWFENPDLKTKGVNLRQSDDEEQVTVDVAEPPEGNQIANAKPNSRKKATAPLTPNAIDHAVGFVKNKLKERGNVQ